MKTTTKDMTTGNIFGQLLAFALPLMIGNVFQMMYNTVDSIVVGNFVSTQALAAVGSTTMIVNMAVFFFNGFSVGASVVIGRFFGAKDLKSLHRAIETTMTLTFIISVIFTVVFALLVPFMLDLMDTPADVMADATTYLRIFFAGITGLLVYNMGSGVLRAVGDSTRPLYFLILTSVMNIGLDVLLVVVFHLGIAGVAYATIISQFVSAVLIMILLVKTSDIYQFSFRDCGIDMKILGQIVLIGLPNGIQSSITAFSNVFVQSYVNFFGSAVMAGWSCYNKINQFVMLPMQSVAMAATTFVSQNVGAKNFKRANKGTKASVLLTEAVTVIIVVAIWLLAAPSVALFSQDEAVIEAGVTFIHWNVFFLLFNVVNHVLAGALRGRGDSTGPMVIMLIGFVAVRQLYLHIVTRFVANTEILVGLSYPVGWALTCFVEVAYYFLKWNKKED